jgi:tRNA threonylcarbamoyladenosine biosynthesis protein TsaB
MELSIDTSTRFASAALTRQGALLAEATWHSNQNHTVELAPAVQRLLAQCAAKPTDLAAVFVALGPGGFSALRVGLGFAKGLAESRGIPLLGVGTLAVEAEAHRSLGLPTYALLDLGRGQAAWSCYAPAEGASADANEEHITAVAEMAEAVRGPAIICGEGLATLGPVLRPLLPPGVLVAASRPPTRHAALLARLGFARLSRGERDDAAALQPRYLRRPSNTLPGGRQA